LSKPFSKKNPILLEEFFDHLVIGKLIKCDSFSIPSILEDKEDPINSYLKRKEKNCNFI
jgi:hypothetical protein